MKSLTSILKIEEITKLASRSNLRLGKAIAEDGKFTIEKSTTYGQTVRVVHKNGQPYTVHLESTPKGLRWKCSCSSRKDLFCPHCIALGLYIITENSKKV